MESRVAVLPTQTGAQQGKGNKWHKICDVCGYSWIEFTCSRQVDGTWLIKSIPGREAKDHEHKTADSRCNICPFCTT